jgi:hypothetical protein
VIEAGLVSLLRSNAPLSALIGTRLYGVLVPSDAKYPCLSYTPMGKPPEVNLDKSAVETKRIQIDCWAKTYTDAKNLQVLLHALLDGYQGTCPDGTTITLSTRDVEADYFESDNETFRAMSEYLFTFPSGQ